LEAYAKAIERSPTSANPWILKAEVLEKTGNLEKALEACDKAIKINSELIGAWLHKGNILRRLKKFDEALEAYNKTIDLDTKFIEGYISKGETFSEMKKYNEALAVYEEALKLSPNSINSVFSLIGKGMALNSLERYEEASDSLLKASNIMPDNYLIWLQLSKVFTNFGQYENAVYSLKKSASLIAKFKAS